MNGGSSETPDTPRYRVCPATVAWANGPAAAVIPGRRMAAASCRGDAWAVSTVTATCAPRWALNAWSNGAFASTSSPAASVEAAAETSTTRPMTRPCVRRPASPRRQALRTALTGRTCAGSSAGRGVRVVSLATWPSTISMTRRAKRAARSGLWVTRMRVCPEALRPTSRSPISSPVAVSSAPVGSSASSSGGRLTSARAIATRCRSPPDSRAG